jgi:hypothetical protein
VPKRVLFGLDCTEIYLGVDSLISTSIQTAERVTSAGSVGRGLSFTYPCIREATGTLKECRPFLVRDS